MCDTNLFNEERKHLESLLKDRINFYLVFSSIFIAGAVGVEKIDPLVRELILYVGALVSFLIGLSVVRTTWLVERVLKRLADDHPLNVVRKGTRIIPNANYLLAFIPIILTALFVWMAWHYAFGSQGAQTALF